MQIGQCHGTTAGARSIGMGIGSIQHQYAPIGSGVLPTNDKNPLLDVNFAGDGRHLFQMLYTAAKGPMALATSLAPCVKDITAAENTWQRGQSQG